jgi:hypothetical protein
MTPVMTRIRWKVMSAMVGEDDEKSGEVRLKCPCFRLPHSLLAEDDESLGKERSLGN